MRFVEAMDLVAEEDRTAALGVATLFRFLNDLAYARNTFRYCAEQNELAVGVVCDQPRERRFARSRWSPEDHAADGAALDRVAQWLAFPEQLFLTEEVFEALGTHSVRERADLLIVGLKQ